MPIMDGLTLIKQLRESLPDCKVIIVTGHDEFSYAQEALRLNVVDYIIKPVDTDELNDVIEKVCLELQSEMEQQKLREQNSKQLERNVPLLREHFCFELLHGQLSNEELKQQLVFLQLPKTPPAYVGVIFLLEMKVKQSLLSNQEKQAMMTALEKLIKQQLVGKEVIVACQMLSGYVYLVGWGDSNYVNLITIDQFIQRELKVRVLVSVERVSGDFLDITNAFKRCQKKVSEQNEVSQIVRGAEHYMTLHFHDSTLTLETIANELDVTPTYLSRLFKQQLGYSFVQALTKIRMKNAMQLLHSTNLTINEISSKVGYETQHYFSTAFKKAVGVSPNAYRKGQVELNEKM